MGLEIWHSSFIIFPALVLLHLVVSPYTKVEESFNIQATHDILFYGLPTNNIFAKLQANFDHMTFPGAVPRTFIGSLILAALTKPGVWMGRMSGYQQQLLVRGALGLLTCSSLLTFVSGIRRAYGRSAAGWFVLLQCSQFHIFYYASRTLPNMFAFVISTFALRFLLPDSGSSLTPVKRTRLAVYLLTLATIIFRSEIVLLLGSHALFLLLSSPNMTSRISMIRTVFTPALASASIAGLILTISIDTYLWQSKSYLWPEMAAFMSNIFPSKDSLGASAWGTSPWHWYCTSALPRLLINPLLLVLIPFGLTRPAIRPGLIGNIVPSLIYTALYSFLPHKETRFLFPILPSVTTSLAIATSYISTRRARSLIAQVSTIAIVTTTVVAGVISHALLLPLSAQGYSGAQALRSLQEHIATHPPPENLRHPLQLNIHLTNLACQTGVTLFLQDDTPTIANSITSTNHDQDPQLVLPGSRDRKYPSLNLTLPHLNPSLKSIIFNKETNIKLLSTPNFWSQFDFVIVEDQSHPAGRWDVIDRIPGLTSKIRILKPDEGRGLISLSASHSESVEGIDQTNKHRGPDALSKLVLNMYGRHIQWVYGAVHDLLREGWGVRQLLRKERFSWTGGYWVHFGLETKLYVLRRAEGVSTAS